MTDLLKHTKYRPDIDGLRAIAVMSVVFYHFFPGRFRGGFIGVDIFFIISGYLISLILFDNFEKKSFSYREFYTRRILRIFPALGAVMAFVLIAGWFLLACDDYALLGKHVVSGVLFISNLVLASESGYFDSAAISKPLLHLWSLGVEEQFYIIWPIIIGFFWHRRTNFLVVSLSIAVLSFIFNILNIDTQPSMVFYSPLSRFWELMIGGVLAYLTLNNSNIILKYTNLKSILGFILLVCGFIFINETLEFPGYLALIPCLGASLLISSSNSWINRNILGNKLFVWIGLISYPLYLWHWPLFSLANISVYSAIGLPIKSKIFLIIVSFMFAWMTYQFIEKPIRNNRNHKNIIVLTLVTILFILGGFGAIVVKTDGLNNYGKERSDYVRYFKNYRITHKIEDVYRRDCNFYDLEKSDAGMPTNIALPSIGKSCYIKPSMGAKSIFIWGDSHAQSLYSGLKNELPESIAILQVASHGCPPDIVESIMNRNNFCKVSNNFALRTITKEKPNIVIIAQYQHHDINKTREIVTKLKKVGINHVIVIGPDPAWSPVLYKEIANRYWLKTPNRISTGLDQSVLNEEKYMRVSLNSADNFQYVSLIDFFCNKEGCLAYINNDRKDGITTFDYGHLTPVASTYLAKSLLVPIIINDLK